MACCSVFRKPHFSLMIHAYSGINKALCSCYKSICQSNEEWGALESMPIVEIIFQ